MNPHPVEVVSIPRGAVKSVAHPTAGRICTQFQFQEVQLKDGNDVNDIIKKIGFNSKRCS